MQKIVGFAACAALAIACGAPSGPGDGERGAETEGAAVSTAAAATTVSATQLKALAAGKSVTLDLSRPGAVARVDVSKGAVDLSRVEIEVAGRTMSAAAIEETASRAAGFTPAYGSFYVVSGAEAAISTWPGGGKCSPITQTDCCDCGWWKGGICESFWCPCYGDECGQPPVFSLSASRQ